MSSDVCSCNLLGILGTGNLQVIHYNLMKCIWLAVQNRWLLFAAVVSLYRLHCLHGRGRRRTYIGTRMHIPYTCTADVTRNDSCIYGGCQWKATTSPWENSIGKINLIKYGIFDFSFGTSSSAFAWLAREFSHSPFAAVSNSTQLVNIFRLNIINGSNENDSMICQFLSLPAFWCGAVCAGVVSFHNS